MYLKKSAYSLAIYLSISIFPGLMVIRDIINHILGHGMLAEEKIMIITPMRLREKPLETERAMNYNNYY